MLSDIPAPNRAGPPASIFLLLPLNAAGIILAGIMDLGSSRLWGATGDSRFTLLMPLRPRSFGQRTLFGLVAFLTASAIYLYAFPQQNVFYAVIVLLHLAVGLAATIVLLPMLRPAGARGNMAVVGGMGIVPARRRDGILAWCIPGRFARSGSGCMRTWWCAQAALGFLITEVWARRAGQNTFSGSVARASCGLPACDRRTGRRDALPARGALG